MVEMHALVYDIALLWLAGLLAASVGLVARRASSAERILALDTLVLVLIGLLAMFAVDRREGYYLDAALVLALVSFVATLAATRYYDEGRPS